MTKALKERVDAEDERKPNNGFERAWPQLIHVMNKALEQQTDFHLIESNVSFLFECHNQSPKCELQIRRRSITKRSLESKKEKAMLS